MTPAVPLVVALGFALLMSGGGQPVRPPTVEELRAALDETATDQFAGSEVSAVRTEPVYQMFLRMNRIDVPDYMLLAILLAGSTRRSPVDVAMELLNRVDGDVTRLMDASIFEKTPGVGDAGRARLLAAAELLRRLETRRATAERKLVTTPQAAFEVLRTVSEGPYEKLSALYLDRRRRVIGTRLLTIGSDAFTIVDPRQILRPALELNAAAIVLAHQHPSGDPIPSEQDHEITGRVQAACRALQIPLLDHLVIGAGDRWTSMAEQGLLPQWVSSGAMFSSER